jgi:hypothetical protein
MARPRATITPSEKPAPNTVDERVVALAEQLGRLVGTAQAKADGWVDLPALNDQLVRIRDGATGLLEQLRGGLSRSARKKPGRKARGKGRRAKRREGRRARKDASKTASPRSRQEIRADDYKGKSGPRNAACPQGFLIVGQWSAAAWRP